MFVDLYDLENEIKMVKGLAKDAGSDGKELLRTVKKAESLLNQAKVAESKGDYETQDKLVEEIKSILG